MNKSELQFCFHLNRGVLQGPSHRAVALLWGGEGTAALRAQLCSWAVNHSAAGRWRARSPAQTCRSSPVTPLTLGAQESERCHGSVMEINDFAAPGEGGGSEKASSPQRLCKSVPARQAPGGAQLPPSPQESVRVQVLTVSAGLTFRRDIARAFVFPQQRLLQSIIIAHPRVQTHKDLIYSATYAP